MPNASVSRKRNKGKERKARKVEKIEAERSRVHSIWYSMLSSQACDHGCTMIPDVDHPVSIFLDDFYEQFRDDNIGNKVLKSTYETHTHIWNDDSYRNVLLDVMIRIGTNMLLLDRTYPQEPLLLFEMILALEEYDKTKCYELAFVGRTVVLKVRDTMGVRISNKRDVLKFFHKRVSCKCLKRMHLEARKTIPKTASCFYCGVEKERQSLSVCSRCMVSHFCSRECQVANWSDHEFYCDAYVNVKVDKHQESEMAVPASSS